MKRQVIHPAPSERALRGPRYWRSLDELADTPGFRNYLEREFPEGASDLDGVDRRHFMKIMAASFALGGVGMAGCRRPESNILPYGRSVEGQIPGLPLYYSTAMPWRRYALPLIAETHQGRPTKVEGNPGYAPHGGASSLHAQASLLDMYDPDRAQSHTQDGRTLEVAEVNALLARIGTDHADGQGLAFLAGFSSSPTRARLVDSLKSKFPRATWAEYEAVSEDPPVEASQAVFGRPLRPIYRFAAAKRVVSIDADFLGSEGGKLYYAREFAKGRRVKTKDDAMNRLYVAESGFTLTGSMADHRLRLATSHMLAFAAALGSKVTGDTSFDRLAQGLDLNPEWISECAADLAAHKGECLVVAGAHLPAAVHAIAHAINAALGNVGATVEFIELTAPAPASLADLAGAIRGGGVKTLVILGGNPVYNAPVDLEWASLQKSVAQVVRLGYHVDETSAHASVNLAEAHYLESWGDGRTFDGTVVPIQPMILPLFGGLTEIEVLARILGEADPDPHALVRATFATLPGGKEPKAFEKFLFDGFLEGTAHATVSPDFNGAGIAGLASAAGRYPALSVDSLEVRLVADYKVDDGRFANNGWLQECPDPMTKVSWDNLILVSPKLGKALGIQSRGSVLQVARDETQPIAKGIEGAHVGELTVNGRSVRGPMHIQPGLSDFTVVVSLGYGRTVTGRVGAHAGFNAYALRASDALHVATGGKLRVTGETMQVANVQEHWSMEGRDLVREANLSEFQEHPEFAQEEGMESETPPVLTAPEAAEPVEAQVTKIPRGNSLYSTPEFKDHVEQWGMNIDLNTCIGCNACVVACQSENNVPIVGKDQSIRGRQMHWIRIDRYFSDGRASTAAFGGEGNREIPEDPQVSLQPVACMQCELAPCEMVCPVNATIHDDQGINVMAYNRCIGTRYCANNCPYKVRRFNYFDWNQRSLDSLYLGPLGPHGMPELLKMAKNPEVTVRMRGVMEKCTYCIQRVENGKIDWKVKSAREGDPGNVAVPDGYIKTACQQVCPVEAIVFGNILDPNSAVSQAKARVQDYSLLGYLNTRPRTTYLARLRNPNPRMPDYRAQPLSRAEHDAKSDAAFPKNGGKLTMAHATSTAATPAILSEVKPAALPRAALVEHNRSFTWISDKICGIVEGKTPAWWWWCFIVACCIASFTVCGIAYEVATGIGVWGHRSPINWGWPIVNFVFWIGIGHAGTLISAILCLLRQKWRTSINRSAEAMTIFAVVCAGIFPVFHVGRVWYAWFLFPLPNYNFIWPQFRSPLEWDVFAVSTYGTVSVLFWYVGMIPDLALLRDRFAAAGRILRARIYGLFAMGWRGSARAWSHYEMAYLILAGIATPLVLSVHTIVSFDFAVSLIPGWHTTIFPPYFVAGAIFSGFGMVLTLMLPLRAIYRLEDLITQYHIDCMCKITLATGSMVGYAYAMEFFIAWYGGNPYEGFTFINRAFGPFAWAYWIMVSCNVITPQFFWFKAVRQNTSMVWILSLFVNLGMWFERFVIICTSLTRDFLPTSWGYLSPTVVDIFTFFGTFGVFSVLFLLFIRFLPMMAIAEIKAVTPSADPHAGPPPHGGVDPIDLAHHH